MISLNDRDCAGSSSAVAPALPDSPDQRAAGCTSNGVPNRRVGTGDCSVGESASIDRSCHGSVPTDAPLGELGPPGEPFGNEAVDSQAPVPSYPPLQSEPPRLAAMTPAGEEPIDLQLLADPEAFAEIVASLTSHGCTVTLRVRDLLDWPDEGRKAFLSLARVLGSSAVIQFSSDTQSFADPFEAIVSILESDAANFARCKAGRNMALDAAVLFHPDDLPIACSVIARKLKSLKVSNVRADALLKEARRRAEQYGNQPPGESLAVRDTFTDAPVPGDVVFPRNWHVSMSGISRAGREPAILITAPAVLTLRYKQLDDDVELLGVAWFRDGRWHEHIAERLTLASKANVIELSTYGFPVNSNNSEMLVQFFADFEAENQELLPIKWSTSRMGWVNCGGRTGFVLGTNFLTANSSGSAAEPVCQEVIFRGADRGDEQLAAAFVVGGEVALWREALAQCSGYPVVKLLVYASLATPLLKILKASNFVIDLAGETSKGKTIAQRIAASCWGCPDERSENSVLLTWDASRVGIERAAGIQQCLPLILDDTKRAKHRDDVGQAVYDVTSGRGRTRGSRKGMQPTYTWRTIMISSGEAPITSFTEDGGTRPRVLTFWGSPFGPACAGLAERVNGINNVVVENYGHAGQMFVQFLLDHEEHWDDMKRRYSQLRDEYVRLAHDNHLAARMADAFAVLALCAELVHLAIDMPWPQENPVDRLRDRLVGEATDADIAVEAMEAVISWCVSHQGEFDGRRSDENDEPPQGWAGRWDAGPPSSPHCWPYLGLLPNKFNDILEERGHDPKAILRMWSDRSWISHDPSSGKARRRTRVGGPSTWLVSIPAEVVARFLGNDAPGDPGVPLRPFVPADNRGNGGGTAEGTS